MEEPQAVIADAFAKLKRSISEEDAHNFASTELKDVWTAVREIDSQQRRRKSAQNLRRVEPLLRGIKKYAKVIEVLCNGTPFMPYAWAPIKLMLEIACRHRDVFETLLSAYAEIGAALPRFDRYNEAFSTNLEFQNALAAVYAEILDFHQRAYKFFRRRAWHIMFLSLWKDFGNRFDNIVTSLKKQRDFIDIEAASFDIIEAKQARTTMQDDIRRKQKQELEVLEDSEKKLKIAQLQHSLAWISTDGKAQETQYERTVKRKHEGTCKWIANEKHFKTWIKDDVRRPCLWLNGKPGSGKSVMCSHVIQTLADTPDLTTCYYFCNSQDTGNVCHEIFMNIVLQILRKHPDICTLIANNYAYQGLSSGMVQLKALLPQLLTVIGCVRLVVDGVDECHKESQKAILKEFQAICTTPTAHCKVLFSSRKEVHIHQKLTGLPQISLDGRQEVDWDIRTFVKYKISKLETSDQDLVSMIESLLVEKANGMFLWVRLVTHELKHCYSDIILEETARRLPQGLKAAYGRILDRIKDDDSRVAKYMALRILGWMSCAHRVLKVHEILDGIAFDSSNMSLTTRGKIRKRVLEFCHPLIEEGPKNTVDFVHFSAKEYILEEEYQAAGPFICRQTAHLDITFSCVALLNSCSQLRPLYSTPDQRAAIIVRGFHGLLVYAEAFWYKHLLEFCRVSAYEQRSFPPELLAQLQLLLIFRKESFEASNAAQSVESRESGMNDRGLEALDHLPDIKRLVSDVLMYRAEINKKYGTNNSSEAPSLNSYDKDPTDFSSIRYHYQTVVESLLSSRALEKFPNLPEADLTTFQETYGASGFLCRYLHCISSTDGFDSSSERVKHESQHQQKFRCAFSSCVFFPPGFVNRNMLKKHNERYHAIIANGPSLADSVQNTIQNSNVDSLIRADSEQPRSTVSIFSVDKHDVESVSASMSVTVQPTLILDGSSKEEEYKMKCICSYGEDDGNIIYCETCDTWQHIECYYPGRVDDSLKEGSEHSCTDCDPRLLDRATANDRNLTGQERLYNEVKKGDKDALSGSHEQVLEPLSTAETCSKLLVILKNVEKQTAALHFKHNSNQIGFLDLSEFRVFRLLQQNLEAGGYKTAHEFIASANFLFTDSRKEPLILALGPKYATRMEDALWAEILKVPEWRYLQKNICPW